MNYRGWYIVLYQDSGTVSSAAIIEWILTGSVIELILNRGHTEWKFSSVKNELNC